jgi:hypothetical protein
MGTPRTLGAVTVSSSPIPAMLAAAGYTGTVIAATAFTISNNIVTMYLNIATFPVDGYNGPNGYPVSNAATQSSFDIHGGNAGSSPQGSGGQQVCLWGFTTGTYFNGKTVTVLDCNPTAGYFRFYFAHAGVGYTSDAGNTAPVPKESYRVIRIECGQGIGTDLIYVGDLNVSSTRYITALSLSGQIAVEISSDNLRADRVMLASTSTSDVAQVSVLY